MIFYCIAAIVFSFILFLSNNHRLSHSPHLPNLRNTSNTPNPSNTKMAPTKGKPDTKKPTPSKSKPLSSSSRVSKSKDAAAKRPPAEEVKTKPRSDPSQLKKKQKRAYTEEELDLPRLNAITPVGVVKPKGKKKGKTFVDDRVGFLFLPMFCFELRNELRSLLGDE